MGWVIPLPGPEQDPGAEGSSAGAEEASRPAAPLDPASARAFVAGAYDELQRDIYSFALHASRDADVAADVSQDAFIRLLTECERHGPPEYLKAWLMRVSANLVISRGRHVAVADRYVARHGQAGLTTASPEAGLLHQEHRARVQVMLGHVSADARTALLLAAEGYSGREIASFIGRTELATRVLMCRARQQLRDLLATSEADLLEA